MLTSTQSNFVVMGWNSQGWGRDKSASKTAVISNSGADIFMLCETHRRYDEVLEIPGFTFIGNNRDFLHKNACAGSGGVAILVSDSMMNKYTVDCVDANCEGMLAVKLINKLTWSHNLQSDIPTVLTVHILHQNPSHTWNFQGENIRSSAQGYDLYIY